MYHKLAQISLLIGFLCFSIVPLFSQDEVRNLDSFDELVVSGKVRVMLVKGEAAKAEIDYYNLKADDININLKGRRLRITLNDGLIKNHQEVDVRLYYQELSSISVIAGAQLRSEEPIEAEDLRVRARSGAEVKLEIDTKVLEANAFEGGQLTLRGHTEKQDATANTGGRYEGHGVISQTTYVRVSTGGYASVHAKAMLDAVASLGGRIEYKGEPEKKYTKRNLAGEISGW